MESSDQLRARHKEVGNLIRNWRINEGMTRNELCIASEVHHNSICRAEAGENMTLMNLMKIADGLGVRIQDLLYED